MNLPHILAARLDGPADVAAMLLDLGQAAFEYYVNNPEEVPQDNTVTQAFISYHRNAINTVAVNLAHVVATARGEGIELPAWMLSRYQRLTTASFNVEVGTQLDMRALLSMRSLLDSMLAEISAHTKRT